MLFRRLTAGAIAALLLACLTPPARAQDAAVAPAAQLRTLANGMRIVVLEDHAAPVAQTHIYYRFGALDETPGKTGLAHALEHMMFRGTRSLSAAGLDDFTARLGADVNAQTENETTHFYFVLPADHVPDALRIEADRMRNLKLDPKDWNLERGAVLQEWAQDHSDPTFSFVFGDAKRVYPNSRLGENALGERADIEKATVADLRRYYDAWYRPNNATLVVTGDVTAADVFAEAERDFGPIAAAPLPQRRTHDATAASGVTTSAKAESPFTLVDNAYAAPGEAPATEPEQIRNDLALQAIFNDRGPFRKALVESGLTLGYVPLPVEDRRASIVHVLLIVAPGHTAKEAEDAYDATLASVLKEGINPDYVAAAKRSAISGLTYARDSIVGLAEAIGGAYVYPDDTDPTKYPALFNTPTVAEVNATARAIYAKPAVVGVLEPTTTDPSKFKPPSGLSTSVSDNFGSRVPNGPLVQPAWLKTSLKRPLALKSAVNPEITKLPNGLTLLVQRVPTNDTVFVQGVIRQAATFDPAGKEGLGAVTSGTMGWGSAKYDYDAQHKLADDLAAQIGIGTEFEAHGFAKDFPALLDVLADGVRHPRFPADKLALVKQQATALASRRALQPEYRASRAFAEALYPAGDPALRQDSPQSLGAIGMDDVKAYFAKYVRPDTTTLVVVGNVDPADVRARVSAAFGDWTNDGPRPDISLPPLALRPAKRQQVQTAAQDVSVQIGAPAPKRTDAIYPALVLANAVYGGGSFDSRLYREVRTKRGLVYFATSSLQSDRDRGLLRISFRAVPAKVNAADALVRSELKKMQTTLVTSDELTRAKTRVVSETINAEQATSTIAGDLMQIGVQGLRPDYFATLSQRYANISAVQVRDAARKGFHPDNLIEVRTGPVK